MSGEGAPVEYSGLSEVAKAWGTVATDGGLAEGLIAQAEQTRQPFDPEVTLFVDDSAESGEARRMFANGTEEVRTVSSPDVRVPTAVFAFSAYGGLQGIAELVQELQSLRRATGAAYERHVRNQSDASAERRPFASRLT